MLLLLAALLPVAGHANDAIEKRLSDELKKRNLPSISVGIVRDGKLDYTKSLGLADRASQRPAAPDTVYRIGSVSKVFTATLLAALRDQGVVRLDDPISKFLPKGFKVPSDPRGLPEITLRHLAMHTSGLPRLPVNLAARGEDAYGGYSADALLEGLARTKLAFPTGADCVYSNLGAGLLGHLLERAAGKPYERLLHELIFDPLEMRQSGVALDAEMKKRFATGYRENNTEVEAPEWDLGVLAPAGGIASSVNDLARFLALQMKAGQADVKPIAGGTLTEMHTPQRLIGRNWDLAVGLGWHIRKNADGDIVWHNGRVAGHYAFIGFCAAKRVGVIVLTNASIDLDELSVWILKQAIRPADVDGGAAAPAPKKKADAQPALEKTAAALARYIIEKPSDEVGDLFHDSFKKQIPLPAIKAVLGKIAKDHGPCRGVASLKRGEDDHHAIVEFRFDNNQTVQAILEIETSDPPKIVSLFFPPA